MPTPFVWFDRFVIDHTAATPDILEGPAGWANTDIGPMTILSACDAQVTSTASCNAIDGALGWAHDAEIRGFPMADHAPKRCANVNAETLNGPATMATFMMEPGGPEPTIRECDAGITR